MDNEDQLAGQMDIFDCFDFLKVNDENDLETMTLEYIAEQIQRRTGFKFRQSKQFDGYYECQFLGGDVNADFDVGRFSCDGLKHKAGQKFIGCSVNMRVGSMSGRSSPCYDIDEAAEFFKKNVKAWIVAVGEEKERRKKQKAREDNEI